MAKYPKRQKVKRYRRSFYSREMRVKKGIGIAVLVLVVLAAAWVAAPHVLDWATHTWYTVVRNRIFLPPPRRAGALRPQPRARRRPWRRNRQLLRRPSRKW